MSNTFLKRAALCTVLAAGSAPALAMDQDTAGDIVTGLVGVAAFGSTYAYDDHDGRWMLIKSLGWSYATNGALRLALNDTDWGTRPNGGPYGFPSGHIGFMAANASFLQDRYGWQWGVPAWLATGYVAYERVHQTGHHRWRDVIAATAIAQGFSCYFVEPYDRKLAIGPMIEPGATGLSVSYNF